MTITAILQKAETFLSRLNKPAAELARNLAGVLLALMTAIVMLQVVARYGLNNSLSWTEELSKTMMVWTAFLVAPWAYRESENVSIDFFTESLPKPLKTFLQIILTLLVLWICAVFFRESLEFILRGMQSKSPTLPLPTGLFYVVVPVSFLMLLLTGLELTLKQTAELFDRTDITAAGEEN